MGCCAHCVGAGKVFGTRQAYKDLKRLRTKGPSHSTRVLLDAMQGLGVEDATVLDIGGGVGAIQIGLLDSGAARVVGVDASAAYLEVAEEEMQRRGLWDRVEYRFGDFLEVAEDLTPADVVTLDRVVCCYPHMKELMVRSTALAGRMVGLVYPRDRWWVRGGVGGANAWLKFRKSPFRVFVHPTAEVDGLVRDAGFSQVFRATTLIWQVVLYARPGEAAA